MTAIQTLKSATACADCGRPDVVAGDGHTVTHHYNSTACASVVASIPVDDVAAATRAREHAEAAWGDAIRDALARGESAISIAARAGISRARVYQIRDGRR